MRRTALLLFAMIAGLVLLVARQNEQEAFKAPAIEASATP